MSLGNITSSFSSWSFTVHIAILKMSQLSEWNPFKLCGQWFITCWAQALLLFDTCYSLMELQPQRYSLGNALVPCSHGLEPFSFFPDFSLCLLQLSRRWPWSLWGHAWGHWGMRLCNFCQYKQINWAEVKDNSIEKEFSSWQYFLKEETWYSV
jgi:hypothetical protein